MGLNGFIAALTSKLFMCFFLIVRKTIRAEQVQGNLYLQINMTFNLSVVGYEAVSCNTSDNTQAIMRL